MGVFGLRPRTTEEVTEYLNAPCVVLRQRIVRLTRASSRRSFLLLPFPAPDSDSIVLSLCGTGSPSARRTKPAGAGHSEQKATSALSSRNLLVESGEIPDETFNIGPARPPNGRWLRRGPAPRFDTQRILINRRKKPALSRSTIARELAA